MTIRETAYKKKIGENLLSFLLHPIPFALSLVLDIRVQLDASSHSIVLLIIMHLSRLLIGQTMAGLHTLVSDDTPFIILVLKELILVGFGFVSLLLLSFDMSMWF